MVRAGRMVAALRSTLLVLLLAACKDVVAGPDSYLPLKPLYLMQPDRPMLTLAGPIVFTDSMGSYTLVGGEVRLTPRSSRHGQATRRWTFVQSLSDSTIEVVATVTYERDGNALQIYDAAGQPFRVWTLVSDTRLLMEDAYCHPVTNVCIDQLPLYVYDASPLPLTPYEP